MGLEQIKGMDGFHFVDFSGGWFPGKNRNDVPAGFYTENGKTTQNLTIGFPDLQHCFYEDGYLRKFYGYDTVPSAQVNSGGDGLGIGVADWKGELTQFGIFGSKFYEFSSAGVATDRTGAVTINTSQPYLFKTHIQGSNRFIIGGNGSGDMFTFSGTGNNIAALSGSPLKYHSFDYYGERWWGVTPNSNWNFLHGSDFTDPTSNWNASGQIFPFKDTLTGVVNAGGWLAVIGRETVNSLQGFGETSFRKDEDIFPFGSPAHRTFVHGQYFDSYYQTWVEGFYMVTWTGPVFISSSKRVYDLGLSMKTTWNSSTGVNKANLDKACAAWMEDSKKYVFAVPWDDDTNPTRLFVIDAERGGRVWPMPDILDDGSTVHSIRDLKVMRDANEKEWLYMQDSNGWYYKFDPDENNYNPGGTKVGIEAHAESPTFNLMGVHDLREPQMSAKQSGSWNVTVFFNFDNASGDGSQANFDLASDADTLTNSFTLGASTLGGSDYVFDDLDADGAGQKLQFKFKNYNADEAFFIEELILWMKFLRKTSMR